jgi:hypothetical protein
MRSPKRLGGGEPTATDGRSWIGQSSTSRCNSDRGGRIVVSWLVRSASPSPFSLSGRLLRQKGREAVGHGHRNREVPGCWTMRSGCSFRAPADVDDLRHRRGHGGRYHRIVAGDGGHTLAQSASFATYGNAEKSARMVRDGAAWGLLEGPVSPDSLVDVNARRDASDAERWLHEGGSFSRGAMPT